MRSTYLSTSYGSSFLYERRGVYEQPNGRKKRRDDDDDRVGKKERRGRKV